jgi:hypothetical protein
MQGHGFPRLYGDQINSVQRARCVSGVGEGREESSGGRPWSSACELPGLSDPSGHQGLARSLKGIDVVNAGFLRFLLLAAPFLGDVSYLRPQYIRRGTLSPPRPGRRA